MNIAGMHIAIEQKLQNINAFVNENFDPEEIDLIINEEQETFIKNRLTPDSNPKKRGFEDTGKRLADLQVLVKEVVLLPIIDNSNPDKRKYLLSYAAPVVVTNAVVGAVYQIISTGNTNFVSIGAPSNSVGTVFMASGAGVGTGTIAQFDFFLPIPGATRVNLIVNARALSLEQEITPRYLGMAQTITIPSIPTPVRGDFYIALTTGTYVSFSGLPALRGDILYYTGAIWVIKTLPAYNYPSYNAPVRIVKHENMYRNQPNPFAKQTERSPLAVMQENSLMVPCSERFILKDMFMVYLRKPQIVSLSLLKNCELPEHTHYEIVDLVVNHILEAIESRRFQSSSIQSLKNE